MRHKIMSGLMVAIVPGLLVLLTPITGLGVTKTFSLQIPFRGALRVPVGDVKIVLDLAGDPTGSVLKVAGTDIPLVPGFETVNGDDVTFIRIPGENQVTIVYEPRSKWDSDTNRCKSQAFMTYEVAMEFQGPEILAYRMNTHTVAKELETEHGSGTIFCGNSFRRVRTSAAAIIVSGTEPLDTSLFKGRLPLDIVLVLDKSGSMASLPPPPLPGGFTDTKWDLMKEAVIQFVNLWAQADLGVISTGGALSASVPKDRIAAVFFSSSAETVSFPGPLTFVERGPNPAISWMPIKTMADSRSPGGSTGMGQALQQGIGVYKSDPTPAAAKNDVTVLLMTDGIQNVPLPRIDPDADGDMSISTLFPTCLQTELVSCGVPVLTIAMGVPLAGSAEDQLLDNVAKQTSGRTMVADDPNDMATVFTDALYNALKGNTLSLLARKHDTLESAPSAPLPFMVDGSTRRATLVLGWHGGQSHRLDLEFRAPDGTVVKPKVRLDSANSTVQSIDVPESGPIGNWTVRVLRATPSIPIPPPDLLVSRGNETGGQVTMRKVGLREMPDPRKLGPAPAQPAPQTQRTLYHLSAYGVDQKLHYRFSLPPVNDGTGDTMVLTADVSFDGKGLTNLPPNAITLKIERPGTGLGTLLHNTTVSGDVLKTETAPGADVTTPYVRKIEHLDKNGQLDGSRPQLLGSSFVLQDNGSAASGDTAANDSIYAASFADTSRPGLYRFQVTLDWDDPRTGRIRRIETIERVVKVNSDPDASEAVVTSQQGGVVLIRVTPRDKFNNFFGPSSGNPITVKVTGGGNLASITDPNQTGDYIVRLENVPPGADPHVVIVVDGRTIKDDNISHLPGGGGTTVPPGFKRWGLSLHSGISFPHGDFNSAFNPGPNFGVDLEYRIKPQFSVEGIYTFHRFNGQNFGIFTVPDVNLHQLSANGKIYGSTSPARPFFNFGGGLYKFDPGSTNGGINLGGGVQFDVTPNFAIDTMYNFHNVFTGGGGTRFSTVQGGVRFRF